MRTVAVVSTFAAVVALLAGVDAFSSPAANSIRTTNTALFGYVPDGFTAESYKKFKEEEKAKALKKKNLGGMGPRGFKSRSMQSFQEALERGEAEHLMPMFNAKEKLRRGEIKKEDIPYMQRGGSWDQSVSIVVVFWKICRVCRTRNVSSDRTSISSSLSLTGCKGCQEEALAQVR